MPSLISSEMESLANAEKTTIRQLRRIYGRKVANLVKIEPVFDDTVYMWICYRSDAKYIYLPTYSFPFTRDDGTKRPTVLDIRFGGDRELRAKFCRRFPIFLLL